MKKPLKLQDVQIATFWNDTHRLTMIFEPLDVVEPPPQLPSAPTGIKLQHIENEKILVPSGIKLKHIEWRKR